jgi:uncharacterized OB-fold protein
VTSLDRALAGAECATDLSRPYWDALAGDRLVFQQCTTCGRHQHFPRHICRWCGAPELSWSEAAGRGQIVGATTVHRSSRPALAARTPYALALVETEEGPLVMALLDGWTPPREGFEAGSGVQGREVSVSFKATRANGLLTVGLI